MLTVVEEDPSLREIAPPAAECEENKFEQQHIGKQEPPNLHKYGDAKVNQSAEDTPRETEKFPSEAKCESRDQTDDIELIKLESLDQPEKHNTSDKEKTSLPEMEETVQTTVRVLTRDQRERLSSIKAAGERAIQKYCSKNPVGQVIMFPPMPDQKFIDAFNAEELNTGKPQQHNQRGYEAECAVYRALERLDVGDDQVIVLHGLEYTKAYQELFMEPTVETEPNVKAGEHDFVVIIRNKPILLLEVKATRSRSDHKLRNVLTSSTKQLNKMEELLEGMAEQCQVTTPIIMKYSVFTEYERGADNYFSKLTNESIWFKDDISSFNIWWKENITARYADCSSSLSSCSMESTLVGLWCVKGNKINENIYSVVHWVQETNIKLKTSLITSNTEKPPTRNVRPAPHIFRKYLDIKFLTKKQEEVLEQSRVIVCGPAGAGKTVLMQGKIIQLVKENKTSQKIVVIVIGDAVAKRYDSVFKIAGISAVLLEQSNSLDITTEINNTTSSVIVVWLPTVIRLRHCEWYNTVIKHASKSWHLFTDDLQCLLWGAAYSDNTVATCIMETVSATLLISSSKTSTELVVWYMCDIAQCRYYINNQHHQQLVQLTKLLSTIPHESIIVLPANMRNTLDLATMLSAMRSIITPLITAAPNTDIILPEQLAGHFIHGTLPRLYVVHEQEQESVLRDVLGSVAEELFSSQPRLDYSELAVIYAGLAASRSFLLSVLTELGVPYTTSNSTGSSDTAATPDNKVWVGDVRETPSREWAAGVVVWDVGYNYTVENRSRFMSILYLAASRVRVHCTIVILFNDGTREFARDMCNVLRPHVLIKKRGF